MRRYPMFALCLLFLVVPMFGCPSTAYVGIRRFTPSETNDKPGRGIEVHVADAVDNRPEAKPKDNMPRYYLVGQAGSWPMRGDIVLTGQALSKTVTDSVKACLLNTGYVVKPAESPVDAGLIKTAPPMVLNTAIEKFWCRFEAAFPLADTTVDLKLLFEVTDKRTGEVVWKREIGGRTSPLVPWGGDEVYESALNNAFNKTMQEFQSAVSSDEFRNALVGTGVPVEKLK